MRDAAKRRAEEQSHGGGGFSIGLPDGVSFFKNDGKTVEFDFIPYVITDPRNPDVVAGRLQVGDLVDGRTYWMHRDIGAEQKPYICLKTIGQRCPICEAQVAMAKNPKADPDDAKALKSKERVLYNVIDVADKDGKVMVFDISYHLFTKQLEHEQREREEYYDYADPDNGYTLRIRWEKKSIGRGEPFHEADRIDFTKRKPLSDADLKAAVDLDACLTILPYDKLEAIFLGVETPAEPAKPEPAGRGSEEGTRGSRRSEPAASAPAESTRGRREPTAPPAEEPAPRGRGRSAEPPAADPHRHDPDAQRARGAAPAEDEHVYKGELDENKCPGGGTFGVDENELKHCKDCDDKVWRSCRDEKDRLAREAKSKPEEKPAGRRGR